MASEAKTEQKNLRFSPEILTELDTLCERERRSANNMIEVLIHEAFLKQKQDQAALSLPQGS